MKHLLQASTIVLLLSLCQIGLYGQCPFDPTIEGDTVLCPGAASYLNTQGYDAYQWNYRYFGSSDPAQPILGATGQTLEVTSDLYLAYVSVDAMLNNCTERSPEVLIDVYSFLPMTVQSTGDFSIDGNANANLCPGDTMWLIAQLPYTINFQWYLDDVAIPGANNDTLVVTAPGAFFVEGSPELCPDFLSRMEGYIFVITATGPNCASAVEGPDKPSALTANAFYSPDRAEISLRSEEPGVVEASVWNSEGRLVATTEFTNQGKVATGNLPPGLYVVRLQSGGRQAVFKTVLPGH